VSRRAVATELKGHAPSPQPSPPTGNRRERGLRLSFFRVTSPCMGGLTRRTAGCASLSRPTALATGPGADRGAVKTNPVGEYPSRQEFVAGAKGHKPPAPLFSRNPGAFFDGPGCPPLSHPAFCSGGRCRTSAPGCPGAAHRAARGRRCRRARHALCPCMTSAPGCPAAPHRAARGRRCRRARRALCLSFFRVTSPCMGGLTRRTAGCASLSRPTALQPSPRKLKPETGKRKPKT